MKEDIEVKLKRERVEACLNYRWFKKRNDVGNCGVRRKKMDKEENPRRKKTDLQQQHKGHQTRRGGGEKQKRR